MSIDPIYKIITDTNVYIIDLTNIDAMNATVKKQNVENPDGSIVDVFLYLKDRKDPIVMTNIQMIILLNLYTVLLKFKTDFYSFKPMAFVGG